MKSPRWVFNSLTPELIVGGMKVQVDACGVFKCIQDIKENKYLELLHVFQQVSEKPVVVARQSQQFHVTSL